MLLYEFLSGTSGEFLSDYEYSKYIKSSYLTIPPIV